MVRRSRTDAFHGKCFSLSLGIATRRNAGLTQSSTRRLWSEYPESANCVAEVDDGGRSPFVSRCPIEWRKSFFIMQLALRGSSRTTVASSPGPSNVPRSGTSPVASIGLP